MTVIMLIFVISLASGMIGTPIVRHFAIRLGFIAVPKSDRAHTEPTALMGGLAIYGAATIAVLLITVVTSYTVGNRFRLLEFYGIVLGASLMAAIGLWDDRYPLGSRLKLALQVMPAVIVFVAGVRISLPVLPYEAVEVGINFFLTIGWILFITNALNYMDNADGVAIMTTATASSIFTLIAILNGQELVSILGAALVGASLGFARYNLPLPRSTIFMGDAGSLFLGFLLAVLGIKIRIPVNDIQITWMVPIIVLGLPIFDIVLVYISRKRRGVSFLQGGVDHTSHRLTRLGMDKLSMALAISLISGALGLVAIFITQANVAEAYVVAFSLAGLAGYVLWRLEFNASAYLRTGEQAPAASPLAVEQG